MEGELVDVVVKVPQPRVAAFYAMVGDWLASDGQPLADESPRAWDADAVDAARELLNKLSKPARAIFDVLGSSAGQKYGADELAATCDIEKGKYGIAGTLAWPGRHCRALGRVLPIETESNEGEVTQYWMTRDVADLFARARTDA